jgi:hypothetical protein
MASWAGPPRPPRPPRAEQLSKLLRLFARLAGIALSLFAVLALVPAGEAHSAARGCWSQYSYDGVQSPSTAYGVATTMTMRSPSIVRSGHVAAWIGVGGAGAGPRGADEWVQAGIAQDAGHVAVLYYEYKRPGDAAATYVRLQPVSAGEAHTFAVTELASRPGVWRVRIDGIAWGAPVVLPGSHGKFAPNATAESWDGGVVGSCNGYSFAFAGLSLRLRYAGSWEAFGLSRVLRDPAYALRLGTDGFSASS